MEKTTHRQAITAQLDKREGFDRKQKNEKRGKQPQGATQIEFPEADGRGLVPLLQEQAGNQKSAEHKENVDAERASLKKRDISMVGHNDEHGEGADAIERGPVSQTKRRRHYVWANVSSSIV